MSQQQLRRAGILVALALAVRLIPAWLLQVEVADVAGYHTTGSAVLRGDNVYALQTLFPYLPYSQFVQAWATQLASFTHVRFDFLIKLPSILIDVAAVPLIFSYLSRRGRSVRRATLWSLGWALNPVAIMIAAFHGNLMSVLPGLLVGALVAVEVAEQSRNRRAVLVIAALLLGLAVAMRAFPILLLPVFLVLVCRGISEVALFSVGATFAALFSSLPYLLYARSTFLGEFLSYNGLPDFGWTSVLRAAPYLLAGHKLGTFDSELLEMTKVLFLLAYVLSMLTIPLFRRAALGRALLLPILLFYALYGGISAQYYVWLLPLAFAIEELVALPFTLAATGALIGFYTLYQPAILSGRFEWHLEPTYAVGSMYLVGNYLMVLMSVAWALWIIANEIRAYRVHRGAFGPVWPHFLSGLWSSRAYELSVGLGLAPLVMQLIRTCARAQEVVRALVTASAR